MDANSLERKNGALLDPIDARDISLGAISNVASDALERIGAFPDEKYTDISKIPVLDQADKPACVGYARAVYLSWFLYNETYNKNLVSPRFIYAISKMFDGIPDQMGTYPRIAALQNINIGALMEDDCKSDTSLQYNDFIALSLDEKTKIKAALQKISAYVTLEKSEVELVRALNEHGLVEVSLPCDGKWKESPIKNKKADGYHRVLVYGYKREEDDTYFYFRNSWGEDWGKKGNGFFAWKDFYETIRDMYIFVDIPESKLAEIRRIPLDLSHRWLVWMKPGSSGADVRALQYAMKLEGCMNVLEPVDGSYGLKTREAVAKYQKKVGITSDGICGSDTLRFLNESYSKEDLLTKWALTIQSHEGYFAPNKMHPLGTRSWRNRNPGNIRFRGTFAKMATGKDDKDFCIFPSYEVGLEALKLLLKNAATGKSSLYKPSDTLVQFFSRYAPANDGNNPHVYALEVAKKLGVPVDTPISKLI